MIERFRPRSLATHQQTGDAAHFSSEITSQVNGVKVFAKSTSSSSAGVISKARATLATWLSTSDEKSPRRGRLLLEQLESRQLMAADTDMLFTDGVSVASSPSSATVFESGTTAEGEAAPDLVAFARALTDAGVVFYGAEWCPFCTEQKQLFEDGGKFLPFVEVTRSDRTTNALGTANNITTFPTWVFPDSTRATGVLTLATLSQRSGVAIPTSDRPSFAAVGSQTVAIGSPLNLPIDAYDPGGGPVTITVSVADPTLLSANVLSGNRSVRFDLNGYGDLVFQIFESDAPRPAGRFLQLASTDFYDNIIFHRVIDNFVIQGGDPLGTGTGGSTLGTFDDQFNVDLQHNRTGILSYAKSSDDTNDSQFFITEGPTRTLDFNHSIFGQLVEGEDVREAISELGDAADRGTNSSDKPLIDVRINSVDAFVDNENAVIRLKAIGNRTGTTNVTITATDANGNTFTEVVAVSVVADSGMGSNSQPFLNDIPTPAPAPNNAPTTLQLSSVDVEGDAVTYTATSATTGVTATVNATTGLVTVTPSAGFTGNAIVNVAVQPASGVSGALSGQNDNQRVTFAFTAASTTLSAPTSVDLVAASDSGSSSTDNRTNVTSLTFAVTGVQVGNEVRLFAGANEIGRGNATGTTINITTNNIAALGDGTYSITARQFSGNDSSAASPALTVVYDGTQPVSITNFPTVAFTNNLLTLNLAHPDEGNGLTYAFSSSPTGATIDSSLGIINWTPTTAQLGTQSFTLVLTDVAGNVRSETFAVNVVDESTVPVRVSNFPSLAHTLLPLEVDLTHPLETPGSGFRYSFTSAPAGATINATTGLILWTPTAAQAGPQAFTLALTDSAGRVRSENFNINVDNSPVAGTRLEIVNLAGTVVNNVAAGEEFLLRFYAQDTRRAADRNGVFSAFADITFDSTLVSPVTTTPIEYGSNFSSDVNDGTFSTGLIDELGAVSSSLSATRLAEALVATVRFRATRAGTVTFATNPADNGGNDFLLFGEDDLDTSLISYNSLNLTIGGTFTAANDSFTVAQNAAAASFNVLQNDTFAAGTTGTLTLSSVGTPSNGGTVTIVNNAASYRPASGFAGTETFTYVATSSTGGTQTATVTMTVTGTNNPPPIAVADAFTVVEDAASASFDVRVNDSTTDSGETISVSAVGTPSRGGTVSLGTNGASIVYRPAANFFGTETVTYTLLDSRGATATGTATFTVTAVNDAPPAAAIARNVFRGAGASSVATLPDYGTNVDGTAETLTVALVGSSSAGGTFTVSGTGITYSPPSATFTGTDSISYTTTDAGGLTSTGTITISVIDAIPTTYSLTLNNTSGLARLGAALSANLTGTTSNGQSVNRSLALGATSTALRFDNLSPGNYQVEIPAVPFLVGMEQPQTLSFTASQTGGTMNGTFNVGSFNPAFISIRDFFNSAPRQAIFAVVAPGSDSVAIFGEQTAATRVVSPVVNLNAAATSLTIRGNDATGAATQATVPIANDRRVETRATLGEMRLLKISLTTADVTFAAPTATTVSTSSTTPATLTSDSSGEGEASTDNSTAAPTPESSARLFASDASLADGEELQPGEFAKETTFDTDNTAADQAFADVTESLTMISMSGDSIAESGSASISPEAVDELLSSTML